MTPNEKLKKFNERISHELNVFIYFKDKEFYEEVLKPHVANKIEKTIVDYFLLDMYDRGIEYYF